MKRSGPSSTSGSQIPASLRTLLQTRPGDRVLVDCVLRQSPAQQCESCIPPGIVVQVRNVGTGGVVVGLPDGTDRRITADCAALVQVEPVLASDRPLGKGGA